MTPPGVANAELLIEKTPRPPRFPRLSAAWRGTILRLALVGYAMLALLKKIDIHSVLSSSASVGSRALVLAFTAQFLAVVTAAARWRIFMGAYGVELTKRPSVGFLTRTNLIASYFSVLPIPGVAEIVRGRRTRDCWENPATPYLLLGVERITGLFGLLLITAVAIVTSPILQTGVVSTTLLVGTTLALFMGSFIFLAPRVIAHRPLLRERLARIPLVGAPLAGLPTPTSALRIIAAISLSVVSQYLIVLSAAALFAPMDAHATVLVCSRTMPAVILATFISVTPAGIGQREIVFVEFFRNAGVDPVHSFAVSLLFFSVGIAVAALGGLVWLIEKGLGLKPPSLL